MSDDPILKHLEAEVLKLTAELEQTPAYRRLKLAQNMIAEYRGTSAADTTIIAPAVVQHRVRVQAQVDELVAMVDKHKTKTKQVEEAAAEYLIQRGRRATSGELVPAVVNKGIVVTGKVPAKTLASYLSTSKRFDNVPGFGGYGLVEWGGRRTAPASAQPVTPNEITHDGGKLPLNS